MTVAGEPRFAVATFQRVFDTTPVRDVVTLEVLVAGLTRFLVKPKTAAALERTERQIEAALADHLAGRRRAGEHWKRLERARLEAEEAGTNVDDHVRAAAEQLRAEARAAPKRDLRLWSPALFADGGERSSDDVVHLSCLVLDYDRGLPPAEATETWADAFHVIHSTWSYTEAVPKYRLVLPLARPVRPHDWRTVYEWAEERSGHAIDPTKKGAATTFALPAVGSDAAPRLARVHRGPLLDPLLEGLVDGASVPPPALRPTEPNHFTIAIPGHRVLEDALDEPVDESADESETDAAQWSFDLF